MYSRREFLRTAAVGTSIGLAAHTLIAKEEMASSFEVCAFTKPLQDLEFEQLGDLVAEMGFDGIEAPVRPGGHIEPQDVEEELPKLVKVLRQRGLKISILTTAINSLEQPHARRVLEMAHSQGIKFFRMGYYRYDSKQPIDRQLNELKPKIEALVQHSREIGITPLYQNHSGSNRVGAPLWDIYQLLSDYRSEDIGLAYDLGHATIEGGLSWPIQFNLVQPHIQAIYVKDFRWRGSQPTWVPLGQGIADSGFYRRLGDWGFRGPISLHVEYVDDRSVGPHSKLVSAFQSDLRQLKEWLTT